MNSLTGIILAGGKSSRFKSSKYLAKLGGKMLLEIAISKLEPLCQEIIVVSKDEIAEALPIDRGLSPNQLNGDCPHKVKIIIEKSPQYHPLIGIIEGLKASHNEANIVLAVDMPFVTKELIKDLISSPLGGEGKGEGDHGEEVRLYRYKGRPEPLFGYYSKKCLDVFTALLFGQPCPINIKRDKRSTPPETATASATASAGQTGQTGRAGQAVNVQRLRIIDALAKCKVDYVEVKDECVDFFNINTQKDSDEAKRIIESNPKILSN